VERHLKHLGFCPKPKLYFGLKPDNYVLASDPGLKSGAIQHRELTKWRSQFGTSNWGKRGLRIKLFEFTEQGVAMLSGVLHSGHAIKLYWILNKVIRLIFYRTALFLLRLRWNDKVYLVARSGEKINLIFFFLTLAEKHDFIQQQTLLPY
jgi:hypothetical protein